jgi:hypothetical protein
MKDLRERALPVVALALAMACAGCGADKASGAGNPKQPEGTRSEKLEHESCDESDGRMEVLDTNRDGKPDIKRVYDGNNHEKCRVTDLSFNGKPDLYEYFDSDGTIRRREFCYDDTGVVNAIEEYKGGKLFMREYDTSGQHKIDTWEWFDPSAPADPKTGRPAHPIRRERDTTGHGMVDQWWTWDGNKVSIATDHDGDGKPDPASLIVLNAGAKENATAGGASGTSPPSKGGNDAGSDGGPASAAATASTGGGAADGGAP